MYTPQMTQAWLILSSLATIIGFIVMLVILLSVASVMVTLFGFPAIVLMVLCVAIALKLGQSRYSKSRKQSRSFS